MIGHGSGTTTGIGAILTVKATRVGILTIEHRRAVMEGILTAVTRQVSELMKIDRVVIPTATDITTRTAVISLDFADRNGSRRIPLQILKLKPVPEECL